MTWNFFNYCSTAISDLRRMLDKPGCIGCYILDVVRTLIGEGQGWGGGLIKSSSKC